MEMEVPRQSQGYAGEDQDFAAPALPRFSGGGGSDEDDDVGNWHKEDPPPPVQSTQPSMFSIQEPRQSDFGQPRQSDVGHQPSDAAQAVSQMSDMARLHAVSAKERFTSFTADARLGAQVMRVRTGVDAKMQAVRDHKGVTKLLSQVGIGKSSTAAGIACEPPQVTNEPRAGEVLGLFQEDPSLRERIVNFHDSEDHLDEVLPILQDYQRHRQGLAHAEQRLAASLKEHGVRHPGAYGQALQDSAEMHLQASIRRLEAYENEEKYVTSVMLSHTNQASHDCKIAVQAYEACREELRLLYEAREKSSRTKQRLQESGANQVDSKLAPQVEAGFEKAVEAAKEKLQATSDAASVKVAMLEAKHGLDYALALAYHMKNVSTEEQDISGILANVGEPVAALQEAASASSVDINVPRMSTASTSSRAAQVKY